MSMLPMHYRTGFENYHTHYLLVTKQYQKCANSKCRLILLHVTLSLLCKICLGTVVIKLKAISTGYACWMQFSLSHTQ